MSDEPVVHNLEGEQPPEPSEPVVVEDCKIHNDIKDSEEIIRKPEPKRILRPWYEMIDRRSL